MSTVTEMPELLDFLAISQSTQVMFKDQPEWLLDALNKAIENGVKKSVKYRRKSVITLQIKLIPKQMNQFSIEASVNNVEPKPDILPMMAFTDSAGRLYGEDPSQQKLPLNKTIEMKRSHE